MASRKELLQQALQKRFGSASVADIAAAKKIVEESIGKSWTPADQAARGSDLRAALDLVERGDPERVVDYISASADLQISKAAGLVTYCALLCAIAALQLNDPTEGAALRWTIAAVIVFSLFGSAVTLIAVWFRWPPNYSVLETPQKEADWLLDLLILRARMINFAVGLALAATLGLAVNLYLQGPGRPDPAGDMNTSAETGVAVPSNAPPSPGP